jgi:glycine cleavage system aminomethyltransferase T
MSLIVDGVPVAFAEGDSVLVALLRARLYPTGGGCLCLGGDCPHCLASVDGVGYVRTCQVAARPGLVVERSHLGGAKPALVRPADAPRSPASPPELRARHVHCDVVVIGQGESGRRAAAEARSAGKDVVALDAGAGEEAIGIYAGPLVVARVDTGTLNVHPREEIVVATGAAEIQPVAPGAQLEGLLTRRAAEALAGAGIDLGRVVAVGPPPAGVSCESAEGQVIRFEGTERVEAVIVRGDRGERRHECDTVSLALGLHPRDPLVRMGRGLPVRAVGDATLDSTIPPCPAAGVVCPCNGISVEDLDSVWERGFRELELVKRASLAGTGTCQGAVCLPHVRSFIAARGGTLEPPFTARPVTRQLTIGEVAAGAFHRATARTPLHDEHVALGARMERAGGWWRPWTYGDRDEEYRSVRERVSVGDVGTLGKFRVAGPDALALLELLYPTRVAGLKPGRSRYALLLDERGYVLDDGLVCADGEGRYTLTLSSAGSTFGELWIHDWAESRKLDVRIVNQTTSLGAINVTGPLAAELLARAGVAEPPDFAGHGSAVVAGVACRIFRLSFTGELSYELHHAAADSVALWRRLLALGRDLGIRPHGLETLLRLRLEKGHIVVGQDTDFDSTPRRIAHEWAVKLDKPEFVGRHAIERTNRVPLDRRLVGLEMEAPPPIEGAVIWHGDDYAGYVTSSAASPSLGKAVMLGWVRLVDGAIPAEVTIAGRRARMVHPPFSNPCGRPILFPPLRAGTPPAPGPGPTPGNGATSRRRWPRRRSERASRPSRRPESWLRRARSTGRRGRRARWCCASPRTKRW